MSNQRQSDETPLPVSKLNPEPRSDSRGRFWQAVGVATPITLAIVGGWWALSDRLREMEMTMAKMVEWKGNMSAVLVTKEEMERLRNERVAAISVALQPMLTELKVVSTKLDDQRVMLERHIGEEKARTGVKP